jgi:hypothetical protein
MPKWKDDARIINLLDYNQLATLQDTVRAFADPYGLEDVPF